MAYKGILESARKETLPFEDLKQKTQKQADFLEKKIMSLKKRRSVCLSVTNLIEDLQSTPFCDDPGKYHRAVYLLNKRRERVFFENIEDVDMSGHVFKIKQCLPKIKPEEAFTDLCDCKSEAFVLEIYEQTEDSPEGDTWMKCYVLLCTKCQKAFEYGSPRYNSHRF